MTDLPPSDPVLEAAARWREADHAVALATVVRTWGSSPRQPGSQLAVNDAGEFVGSVSGGCVEGAVIQEAEDVLQGGEPRRLEYGVSDEEAWSVGLACGGRVEVWLEKVDGEILDALHAARSVGAAAVVATRLRDGARRVLRPLALDPFGPGDPGLEGEPLEEAARAAVLDDTSRTVELEGEEVFLQVHNPPLRMVVVGAVHVAQPLSAMAALAGFDVTVVDPRKAFATEARFPGVRLVGAWPGEALEELAIDHRTAVVTLTHEPRLDDPALEVALRSEAFYVGALGSRRTQAKRTQRLEERGFDADALARIHGPVGLDIGARTPAEIAVAILAQVVERLRG